MLNVLPEASCTILQSNGAFATFTLLSSTSTFISSSPFSGVVIQWSIAFSSLTRHDSTLNPHHKAYYVIKINQITTLGSSNLPWHSAHLPSTLSLLSLVLTAFFITRVTKRYFWYCGWKQMPRSHTWDFNVYLRLQRKDKGNCKLTTDYDSV